MGPRVHKIAYLRIWILKKTSLSKVFTEHVESRETFFELHIVIVDKGQYHECHSMSESDDTQIACLCRVFREAI